MSAHTTLNSSGLDDGQNFDCHHYREIKYNVLDHFSKYVHHRIEINMFVPIKTIDSTGVATSIGEVNMCSSCINSNLKFIKFQRNARLESNQG